ncbi:MAG: response regulator transcription factor [Rikenellaceae bacterium]|jgi:DNA-binding NarL/FixJ family response regulator|nr:response regulator transcription factor [Rikenellaceae bacterium]
MSTKPIKIILVDDHTLFRNGLGRLLAGDERFEVVGEASSGEEFLELWGRVGTDVVFMDIDMPGGMSGIETSRRLLALDSEARIIALSMHGEQEYYFAMVEAGAKGFLLKNASFDEVATAVEAVAGGGTYFSQELLSSLVTALRHKDEMPHGEALSERETEILPMICGGLSNQQIGERLFISKRTVDKHRANILDKTGCKNTASLVIFAVKNNLIEI